MSDAPTSELKQLPRSPGVRTFSRGRPWQVTVISIAAIVFGYIGLLWKPCTVIPYYFDISWLVGPYDPLPPPPQGMALFLGFTAFSWIVSVLACVAGIGLWMMKPWSRKLILTYAVLALIGTGVGLVVALWTAPQSVDLVKARTTEEITLTDRQLVTAQRTGHTISAISRSFFPLLILGLMNAPHIRRSFDRWSLTAEKPVASQSGEVAG